MNRRLPGTARNFERSGDRDLYWSMLLRFPFPARSLDMDALPAFDVQIICTLCSLPKLLMESVRLQGDGGIQVKDSYITEAWAKIFRCPAYVVSHNGEFKPTSRFTTKEECQAAWDAQRRPATSFVISPRPEGDFITIAGGDAEGEFVSWIERMMGSHRCPKLN